MYKTTFAFTLCLFMAVVSWPASIAAQTELPSLGLVSGLAISPNQEKNLGQAWLRQFQAAAPLFNDPLVKDFAENSIQNLATWNNNLESKALDVLVVNQRQLNAFAVPGGIVGINTGLFVYAPNEDEFISVIAHELAHLSQRHFARRVEAAQEVQWKTLAGLLAGILAASKGHADAGIAAIAGSQAAAIHSQLAWSRTYEQEADRLGMQTLVAAGYAPSAMPRMFQNMQRIADLSGRPPEFLLTHPLTQSRIADAQARADQLEATSGNTEVLAGYDYQLLRVRIIFNQFATSQVAQGQLKTSQLHPEALLYKQALEARANKQPETALQLITELANRQPNHLHSQFLLAEALIEAKHTRQAEEHLHALLQLAPSYYPAQYLLANFYSSQGRWLEARNLFKQLSLSRPNDPDIWFHLAETAGKAGQPMQLHLARAEFFQLTARFKRAFEHLDLAAVEAQKQKLPWGVVSSIRERKKHLQNLVEKLDM